MKEVFITLLWIIFVTDSVLLVLIVLLQSGRGGGLSGMLGGGGMAESALGPKSGLPRITGVMAGIFFVAAILIGIVSRPRQITDHSRPKDGKSAAEQPAAPDAKATPDVKADEAAKNPSAKAETPKAEGATTQTPPAPKTDEASPAKSAPATATTPGATP